MATGNGGSKGRLIILVVLLLAVGGGLAYMKFGRGGAGGIDQMIMAGDLLGKPLADATAALGTEPALQTNPDPNSTAQIYLYTIGADPATAKRVSVQVRAEKITRADIVDAAGNVIPFDPSN